MAHGRGPGASKIHPREPGAHRVRPRTTGAPGDIFFDIFEKQKVWHERPFGHITFLSELKMVFFQKSLISFAKT